MNNLLSQAFGEDGRLLTTEEKQLLFSRLLARLAHEIRNPLSSLDIHFQLLEEDLAQLPPTLRDQTTRRFDVIRGEMNRLENLVEHFLRLSKPSELDLEEIDPARILQRIFDLMQPEAQARQVELILEVEALPVFRADPSQITQALLNLVINALQAVPVRGRVVMAARPSSDGGLVVEVRDTGPGVPMERRTTVFEPFFTTKPEGSGLGLWIATQIAIAHGGSLGVAGPPEGGAVFSFQLPAPLLVPAGHE